MKEFYNVGEKVRGAGREAVLVQVGAGIGKWIDPSDFKRISDAEIELTYDLNDFRSLRGRMPDSVYYYLNNSHPPAHYAETTNDAPDRKRFVDLFRYVRPLNPYMEIDNLKGITFRIQLDYQYRTIKFAYSVCNGDNFNKQNGRTRAQFAFDKDVSTVTIPMPDEGICEGGVLDHIWEYIKSDMRGDIVYRQMVGTGEFY